MELQRELYFEHTVAHELDPSYSVGSSITLRRVALVRATAVQIGS